MEEMLEDPNLDKFRDQFEKLHGAWNEAKDSLPRSQTFVYKIKIARSMLNY